jgi:hypothetical protein
LELGRAATATSSLNETALRTLAGVASGAISLSNFYGKSSVPPLTTAHFLQGGLTTSSYISTTTKFETTTNTTSSAGFTAVVPRAAAPTGCGTTKGVSMRGQDADRSVETSKVTEISGINFSTATLYNPSAESTTQHHGGNGMSEKNIRAIVNRGSRATNNSQTWDFTYEQFSFSTETLSVVTNFPNNGWPRFPVQSTDFDPMAQKQAWNHVNHGTMWHKNSGNSSRVFRLVFATNTLTNLGSYNPYNGHAATEYNACSDGVLGYMQGLYNPGGGSNNLRVWSATFDLTNLTHVNRQQVPQGGIARVDGNVTCSPSSLLYLHGGAQSFSTTVFTNTNSFSLVTFVFTGAISSGMHQGSVTQPFYPNFIGF